MTTENENYADSYDNCAASPTGKHSNDWYANHNCAHCLTGERPHMQQPVTMFENGAEDRRQTDEEKVPEDSRLFRKRYRRQTEADLDLHDRIKDKANELAELLYEVSPINKQMDSDRERGANVQLAIRHLEDCVMRATKGLLG